MSVTAQPACRRAEPVAERPFVCPRSSHLGLTSIPRHRSSRARWSATPAAPTEDHRFRWSEACPRISHLGFADTPRHRSSRARWSATPAAPTEDHLFRWSEACPRTSHLGFPDTPRHRSSRASPAPTDDPGTCGSGACPRTCHLGFPDTPRHRSSRASTAPTEDHRFRWSEACPRTSHLRFCRHTASSFIAGKHRSHSSSSIPLERGFPQKLIDSVGARLAREPVTSVLQTHRVIVHRGQGGAPPRPLQQTIPVPVGAVLARDAGASVSRYRHNLLYQA